MTVRIGTSEACRLLRSAGFKVTQLERGTLLVYKGQESYGFTWRETPEGKGYAAEAIQALAGIAVAA